MLEQGTVPTPLCAPNDFCIVQHNVSWRVVQKTQNRSLHHFGAFVKAGVNPKATKRGHNDSVHSG